MSTNAQRNKISLIAPSIKRAVKYFFGIFGLQLRRKPAPAAEQDADSSARASFAGALRQLSKSGFRPRTVIDVGVAFETETLHHEFQESQILLITPTPQWSQRHLSPID